MRHAFAEMKGCEELVALADFAVCISWKFLEAVEA
jgi:hypothetical protein